MNLTLGSLLAASGSRLYHPLANAPLRLRARFSLRLRYAAIAAIALSVAVAACGPEVTQQEAIDTARSHTHGEMEIVRVQSGTWAELAPAGAQVTDPNRQVWAITLRGTFAIDCTVDATGALVSCPAPSLGLILLDQKDGSALSISRIVRS